MTSDAGTPAQRRRTALEGTALVRPLLLEQYRDLPHQHETAEFGMWVFLATEVMFFGTLLMGFGAYYWLFTEPFQRASSRLNWVIGSINALVLVTTSLTMALAIHSAKLGRRKILVAMLLLTALGGIVFESLKGLEYYTDYRDNLIPGSRFVDSEWTEQEGLQPDQVPHVKLFLLFYWIMTGLHALHLAVGIVAVLALAVLARRGVFSRDYYSPVNVVGIYWHFVDTVWIFLLPLLYLLGTHRY